MYDLLIIGQGLAGTSLALQADRIGKTFHIVDRPQAGAASRVAAGLINPVTGRNLSTTWMAGTLFPYAEQWYRQWEQVYGQAVYHRIPIWRIFSKPKEVDRFHHHLETGNPYVHPLPTADLFAGLLAPLGGAILSPSGWLDTPAFLASNRQQWITKGQLSEGIVAPEALQRKTDHWQWNGIAAEHVVWCDGFWGTGHAAFPNLPFAPTKGEILTLEIPDLPSSQILIKGHFLVPLGQQLFRLGATYHWTQLDGRPTQAAADILLHRLTQLIDLPFRVVDHQAGVRPTVVDRKPLFGESHVQPHQWLFNGLGSKGSTIGPFWAAQLLAHIFQAQPLPDLVRWDRSAKGHNE